MTTGLGEPLHDLDAAMQAVLDRVRADADGVEPGLALAVDASFGGTDDGSPAHHVVVRIEENTTAVGFEPGLESGCGEVMSVLQDAVVDSLGRPWPEVHDDGGSVGVLDVAVEPVGIAHWSLRGRPLCAVGHLVPTCRALGWRIR
jgi:hypothetical protein